jgi:predicted nucleic acid-binding protein
MILVDASVWVDHIDHRMDAMNELLDGYQVVMHPFVAGEILLGSLNRRATWARLFDRLPQVLPVRHNAVMQMMEDRRLFGSGIGYVDLHLLAAAAVTSDVRLWTRDKRLARAAEQLGVGFVV